MPIESIPHQDQASALKYLRSLGIEAALNYNQQNPPPQNLVQADSLETTYNSKAENVKIAFFATGVFFIAGLVANFTDRNATWFYMAGIACGIGGLIYRSKINENKAQLLREISRLRSPVTMFDCPKTYSYKCLGRDVEINVLFKSSTEAGRSPTLSTALDQRVHFVFRKYYDDLDRGLKSETDFKLEELEQRRYLEALILPDVCSICNENQIAVMSYDLHVQIKNPTSPDDDDDFMPFGRKID